MVYKGLMAVCGKVLGVIGVERTPGRFVRGRGYSW